MRQLAFALAGAAALAAAAPAGAQTFYVDDGYRGGRGYGYSDWGGARAEVYIGAPGRRAYTYDRTPRYSYRDREWDGGYSAYAYGGPYVGYRSYRGWGGPYGGVGFGW